MTATFETDLDTPITFFCLNLRFGLADDGPHNWQHRKHAYPALLNAHSSDFYAFQEANDFQIRFLQGLLKDYEMIGQRLPAPDYWQNNIIFYHRRWSCLRSEHFYLSDTPEVPSKFQDSKWPRQCTLGTFQTGTFQLTVVNTHFDFKPEVQLRSVLLILDRLANLQAEGSVVFMGDLNAGPDSSCIAELMSKRAGFKSAFWPHNMGTHHQFRGEAQGEPIDWILFRGNLKRRDNELVTMCVDGILPSDHFPLKATFMVNSGT